MSTAIEVTNVSKVYQLGQFNTGTIGTDLQRWWAIKRGREDPFLKVGETNDRSKKGESNLVWSLKDINFKIEQGDAVGIIGKNGAGKSTLLKILSQITGPTTGSIKIKGRVASLLEVGTGFHPELTGRDNIFLSGAIFGMRKREIARKFDEIVAFSGVERYIDTPVKRYSSGMYVRLAFAVAAHLESEILIVDEVLAVGDAEFQEKCLGKMNDVSIGEGRTVLFVSHNMGAIAQLCSTTILIKHGQIEFQGKTDKAIELYLDQHHSSSLVFEKDKETITNENQFVKIYNSDSDYNVKKEYKHDDEIIIILQVFLPNWNDSLRAALFPCDKLGRRIFFMDIPLKRYYDGNPLIRFSITIPSGTLTPGNYSWTAFIHHPLVSLHDFQEKICDFSVLETGSSLSRYSGFDLGSMYPPSYKVDII